jgi:hypothetical protein
VIEVLEVLQQLPAAEVDSLEAGGNSSLEATEHPDIDAIDVTERETSGE